MVKCRYAPFIIRGKALSESELAEAELRDPLVGDPDPNDPRVSQTWPPTDEARGALVEVETPWEKKARVSREGDQEAFDRLAAQLWGGVPEGVDINANATGLRSIGHDDGSESHELVELVAKYRDRRVGEEAVKPQELHPNALSRFREYWLRYTSHGKGKGYEHRDPMTPGEIVSMITLAFAAYLSCMATGDYREARRLAMKCLPEVPNTDGTPREPSSEMRRRQEDAILCYYWQMLEAGRMNAVSHLREVETVQWYEAMMRGDWVRAYELAVDTELSDKRFVHTVWGLHRQYHADRKPELARQLEERHSKFFN